MAARRCRCSVVSMSAAPESSSGSRPAAPARRCVRRAACRPGPTPGAGGRPRPRSPAESAPECQQLGRALVRAYSPRARAGSAGARRRRRSTPRRARPTATTRTRTRRHAGLAHRREQRAGALDVHRARTRPGRRRTRPSRPGARPRPCRRRARDTSACDVSEPSTSTTPSTPDGRRWNVRTSCPARAISRATAPPRKPLAPVTRTFTARLSFRPRARPSAQRDSAERSIFELCRMSVGSDGDDEHRRDVESGRVANRGHEVAVAERLRGGSRPGRSRVRRRVAAFREGRCRRARPGPRRAATRSAARGRPG